MSYSYIKSVFPNFETSKVYSEDIYNTIGVQLKSQNETKTEELQPFGAEKYVSSFNLNEKQSVKQSENEISKKDNLKFYNLPYTPAKHQNLTEEKKNSNGERMIESFGDQENDHNKYILHVMECKRCKESLLKQLNLWDDKIKMEGYMELASYIIFGIFIILIIDALNKK